MQPTDEHYRQLANYVSQQYAAGIGPHEVAAQLKSGGWPDDAINWVLQGAHLTPVMPQTPPAPAQLAPAPSESSVAQPAPQGQPNQAVLAGSPKRGRLKRGWLILRQGGRIVKADKTLFIYPVLSMVLSLATLLLLLLIVIFTPAHIFLGDSNYNGDSALKPAAYVLFFVFYVLLYAIANFYGAALAAQVLDGFHGKNQGHKTYFAIARSKFGTLFLYAVIQATVGIILDYIAERFKLIGRIVARLLGTAWTLATTFTLPIIITSNDSAPAAIKKSAKLFTSTWGETIAARGSLGIIIFVVNIVLIPLYIGLIVVGAILGSWGIIAAIALIILFDLALGLLSFTITQVTNTGLYYYATTQQIPPSFSPELLQSLLVQKSAKTGLFGRRKK
jgi:hypothetical protein